MKVNYDTNLLELYLNGKGLALEKEFQFVPNRKYRADYAIKGWNILIEIEGGAYINGAHNRPVRFISDMEKYNLATVYGWQLLRLTPQQFNATQAIEWLDMWYQERLTAS
jgi:hypothetical protein